jgi:phosphatidylinositol 4-kinase type 2
LIGKPFSQRTRDHFIPLLTSKQWWQETSKLLHTLFDKDDDFQERMYARQLAVLKGQAWNILETLKQPDQGPLELCRRQRVLVNDEEMDVPVAVPMTVPTTRPPEFHEEMDISSLGQASSAPPQTRLSRTPEASRTLDPISDSYDGDITRTSYDSLDVPGRPSNVESLAGSFLSEDLNRSKPTKPHGYFRRSRNRMSYDGPSRPLLPGGRRRGYSVSDTAGGFLDEDEEERDLGFEAAQDDEVLRRKVIVEQYVSFLSYANGLDLRL